MHMEDVIRSKERERERKLKSENGGTFPHNCFATPHPSTRDWSLLTKEMNGKGRRVCRQRL